LAPIIRIYGNKDREEQKKTPETPRRDQRSAPQQLSFPDERIGGSEAL
jgi:hypothetical protein